MARWWHLWYQLVCLRSLESTMFFPHSMSSIPQLWLELLVPSQLDHHGHRFHRYGVLSLLRTSLDHHLLTSKYSINLVLFYSIACQCYLQLKSHQRQHLESRVVHRDHYLSRSKGEVSNHLQCNISWLACHQGPLMVLWSVPIYLPCCG